MSEELNELREHAEEAKHDPSLVPVTMTMAVLAVLVATVSLLGHRSSTEEVILQNKVTDQWSHYQAKNTRRHNDDLIAGLVGVLAAKDAEAATKFQEKMRAEAESYRDEQKELETKARELEQEFWLAHRKTDRLDLGEVFLEIALVITSITLLSGRRFYWHLGLLFAAAGILIAVSAWIVH
jgi:hypothetical protein